VLTKTNRRRSNRQAQRSDQKIAASAPGVGGLNANAHVIRASHTRHGPRKTWGPLQWAQAAISALYPAGIPHSIDKAKLVEHVNVRLDQNPEYRATRYGYLPRSTVLRALDRLR
jgi:hypothetical protein